MSLLNRVRGKLSGYQADVDPHEWRLPGLSSYSSTTLPRRARTFAGGSGSPRSSRFSFSSSKTSPEKDTDDNDNNSTTPIPDPRIFRNAFIPGDPALAVLGGNLVYPDVGHAAVHLALIECFANLRRGSAWEELPDVDAHPPSYDDVHPDIHSRAPDKELGDGELDGAGSAETGESRPSSPSTTRTTWTDDDESQRRWDLLVRLAVTRFGAWWANIDKMLNHAMAYTPSSYYQMPSSYSPPYSSRSHGMWYALLLEPDYSTRSPYNAACRQHASSPSVVSRLQHLCFPWPAIRDVIDLRTMRYELPRAAGSLFRTLSGQSADVLEYLAAPPAYTRHADGGLLFGSSSGSSSDSPAAAGPDLLFAAVKRQEPFFERALAADWIRAPALEGSLRRAGWAYLRHVVLYDEPLRRDSHDADDAAAADSAPALPFGIELMWRTHRLYPLQYRLFHEGHAVRELRSTVPSLQDRRDKIPPPQDEAPEVCVCWTCERIRDEAPGFAYDASAAAADDDPRYDVALLRGLSSEQLRAIQEDLGFYNAVREARALGLPLPTRSPAVAEKRRRDSMRAEERRSIVFVD
ncbi:hypothetical protein DL766_001773 [Monosporascus sp. MC13-8B]|uniref:Uncharacterized protein n=1 Tax=Monosporascus cannonballus TaxID=155416 RepID=A0ABY0HJM9_9PEZI|nr:hypothetical protein DL762_001731 [Monosporascus cannonballus]RYO99452.1 hypothetical protein DL763_001476 [Monosporascus cannonballus]RYP36895.1 hypothetical protein DL766_001773 [Monosporascus sp. MC13-8B]